MLSLPLIPPFSDSILRKFSKRYIILFSDVVLICSVIRKDGVEYFDVQQVSTLLIVRVIPILVAH